MRTLILSRLFPIWLVFGVSLIINALQARYIWMLQQDAEQIRISGPLRHGARVPDIPVLDLSGTPRLLSYANSKVPTVLYFFQPDCNWCEQNSDHINFLASHLSSRYNVVGLSPVREGLSAYIASHHISFPVYSSLSRDSLAPYHLGITPETIVISPNGIVDRSWDGAYVGTLQHAIEKFFSISLDRRSVIP